MNAVFPTITERIAKGAALLDEKLPGWDKDIDLDRLDLDSPCRCILGQLHFNEDDPSDSFADGMDALGLPYRSDWEYGFDISGEFDNYLRELELLTAGWTHLIMARREAGRR